MSCSLIQIIRRRKDRSGGLRQQGIESDPQAYARRPPTDSDKPQFDAVSASYPGFLHTTSSHELPSNKLRAFTLPELKSATKSFSVQNQLGEGGFGLVYKGTIKPKASGEERVEVAIKQLNTSGLQGHHEWVTEVHFLGMMDNPYLVKLIGYCADDDERGIQRLLVYEYMPNRGLDDHIFCAAAPVLSWQTRIKVALGAARGLAYLHDDKGVIFRDFKTANILLDEGFNPKLSDFGLARQGPDAGKTHVTTGVKGTYGYAAPEYIQTGHLTFKSDVFSFGVVLLEILTGRRAMDRNRPRMEQRLLEWVKPFINDPRKFHLAVDPRLKTEYPTKAAMKFATIAIQCLVKQPRARPKMNNVVAGLEKVLEMTCQWENPTIATTQIAIHNKAPELSVINPKSPRNPNPKPVPTGAPWERFNPPAFPLPAIETEDGTLKLSPLHPRGARQPAGDPLFAMERIDQMPVYYGPSTPERNVESSSVRKSVRSARVQARSNQIRSAMDNRYLSPA